MKKGGVVECVFDEAKQDSDQLILNEKMKKEGMTTPEKGGWKVLRIRTDKKANAFRVAKSIMETILAGDLSM